MSAQNDGGPAFPWTDYNSNDEVYYSCQGMTLRDYFAAKAMAAMLAARFDLRDESIARGAYEYADAMLKAREVKP